MRQKPHLSQACHLFLLRREIPDDSLLAMPLKNDSLFPYEDKYLNVFNWCALSGCLSVCLSVGAELLFPLFVIIAVWNSSCPWKISIYSLVSEICSKMSLVTVNFNYFFFFLIQYLKGSLKVQSVGNSPRARLLFWTVKSMLAA